MATEKCPPQSLLAYGQGFFCNVVIRDTDQARLSLLTDKLTKSKGEYQAHIEIQQLRMESYLVQTNHFTSNYE